MSERRVKGVRRRDVLAGGAAALAGAALGLVPRPLHAQAARTEVRFASAPFFTRAAIDQLFERYNASQTAVQATYVELPSAADGPALQADLVKRLGSADGAPDVFSLDVVAIAAFLDAGLSLPLTADFTPAELAAFFPGMVAGCTVAGQLAAMPWFADCGMLFYRTDILERIGAPVPETWDALVAAAKKGAGKATPYGFLWQGKKSEALVCNVVSAVGSNGGGILAPDGRTVLLAEPAAVAAVTFLRDTVTKHKISPKEVLGFDEEPTRKPFQEGRAVFLRNWSYTWGLAEAEGSPIRGKIGVAPLPHFAGKASASCLGGFQLAVNARTKNRAAATDFLRWISGPEAQLHFATVSGLAPTRQAVFDDPAIATAQPFLARLKNVFTGAIARPVTPRYPKVSAAIQDGVSKALRGGSVAAALGDAKTKIEAILSA